MHRLALQPGHVTTLFVKGAAIGEARYLYGRRWPRHSHPCGPARPFSVNRRRIGTPDRHPKGTSAGARRITGTSLSDGETRAACQNGSPEQQY